MISVRECTALAEWVYDTAKAAPPGAAGWQPLGTRLWGRGFAAACFQKDDASVIAYRGTEPTDPLDLWADWQMLPGTGLDRLDDAVVTAVRSYIPDSSVSDTAAALVRAVSRTPAFRWAVKETANRVPREQGQQAIGFFDEQIACVSSPVTCIVGHSLGGALAQLVSLKRDIPAIVFNSPFIGGLEGGVPRSSIFVLHVNAELDPISTVTREAGSLPHGREITIGLSSPNLAPPNPPRSRLGAWLQRTVVGMGFGPTTALSVGESVPPIGLDAAERIAYHYRVMKYLGAVALHHHSIEMLSREIMSPDYPDFHGSFRSLLPSFE